MPGPPEPALFLGIPAIVASGAMRHLMRMVERVAMTNASVLILGESGAGKELVARAIHHHSLRCAKPWVDISCAALPEHLIESELFGHERGAFSGADSVKPGLFELAHQGTLFLDEIGELEPKMQVKLLRVLDGASYYRLGGVRKISVDVRIVAATNRDLEEAVRMGRFRNDLYHRLSEINLRVPPLRERLDDIMPIAEHFLRQQKPRAWFSPEAIGALKRHTWPGNIRELRNAVMNASVLGYHEEILEADLPAGIQHSAAQPAGTPGGCLDGVERRMILDVLSETGGHRQKAAAKLGISRRTLSRKLKLYTNGPPAGAEEYYPLGAAQ
ncbi:MAG: sigma-54 dependent transcriptional regulator [Bryobacteraceae bacterium]